MLLLGALLLIGGGGRAAEGETDCRDRLGNAVNDLAHGTSMTGACIVYLAPSTVHRPPRPPRSFPRVIVEPKQATIQPCPSRFSAFGTVRSISVSSDIFTGKCRGFGEVEMEGHEARAAQAALDGNLVGSSDRSLRVRFEDPRDLRGGRKRR